MYPEECRFIFENCVFEPEVYLVGFQTIDRDELDRFKKDEGISNFKTDAPSDSEEMIEIAGRLCYNSFISKRPGGNKEYIKHIIEVMHGCYDDKTEILTAEGWKLFKDVSFEDRVATLGKYNTVEYHTPTNIFEYDYSGDMYEFISKGLDLFVTPNHNMYVCKATTKENRKFKNQYEFIKAEDLDNINHYHLKNCEGFFAENVSQTYSISIPWAKLLGFAIGDGHLPIKGKTLRFHIRKERKIKYLQEICKELNIEIRRYNNCEDYIVDIPNDYIELFREMYDENRIKQIPQELLLCNDKAVLEGLFDGLKNSDGHVDKGGAICYDSTSPRLIGQIQQLCLHIGLVANVGYTKTQEERGSLGNKDLTRLYIIYRKGFKPELNRKSKGRIYPTVNKKQYTGKVYCVEVDNHVIYVRRNGIPVWCGNSVLEHSVYNFIITGISRYLHSELIRHRTKSFSIRSTRYVDESKGKFVVPLEVYNDDAAFEDFKAVAEKSLEKYKRIYERNYKDKLICHYLGLSEENEYSMFADYSIKDLEKDVPVPIKTDARKYARGLARTVLPGCLETKVFLTTNARSLRNFLELRANEHADKEIRLLANKMFNLVSVKTPNIFADYQKHVLEDGTFELQTNFRKV